MLDLLESTLILGVEMNKINIKDLELNIDIVDILNTYSLKNTIIIDLNGNIYNSLDEVKNKPIVFYEEFDSSFSLIKDAKNLALKIFENYKPVISGTVCKIKPLPNWQKIIDYNKNMMLYFDHQSDGIELFEDKTLEDYGWYASSLEINYRQICDFIEENCEGILLCYDNEIQFNGFTIVNDIEDVRTKVKEFIKNMALKNIENEIIELEDDDVIEALEYFKIEV